MEKKYWPILQNGDLVDVIAPAMKPSRESLQGLTEFLKSWGLRVRVAKDLIGSDLLCSNSKEYRFKHLKKALLAKDSKMIWCLRGGYGSVHLLNDLKKIKPQAAKIFMGFSDITNLHLFLNQKWGWSTIHGSHIGRFSTHEATALEEKRVKEIIFGQKIKLTYKLKALNSLAKKNQKIPTQIIGGNLVNLQTSLGTSWQMQAKESVLFFEEIDERAYKIDRIFQHMQELKAFKGAKAIVFGQFTGGKEPNGQSLVPKYLKAWAEEQNIPVFSGIQSGHGANQHPLPLNTKTILNCGLKPSIEIESGAQQP